MQLSFALWFEFCFKSVAYPPYVQTVQWAKVHINETLQCVRNMWITVV